MVSGFVLFGTGLALAGFGAWLRGNPNCDAADLGRSCVAASLSVAVIGAALAGAGWLRVKRMESGDGEEPEQRGLLGSRPGLVLFALILVGLVALAAVLPLGRLPVDVYAHAAPAPGALPQDLLPPALGGLNRTSLAFSLPNVTTEATADYEGGVFVKVTRFNATNETAQNATPETLAAASQAADDYLNRQYGKLDPAQGARECVKAAPRHWFTQTGPGPSVIGWRAGNFVFEVTAPSAQVRDGAAAALSA